MIKKYTVLSRATRAAILKRVDALSLKEQNEYSYYLSFARSIFSESPQMEAAERALRRFVVILNLYLSKYTTASNYELTLRIITPILKESGVYDKVAEYLENMKKSWSDTVTFPTQEGSFRGLEGKILSEMAYFSSLTELQLRQCIVFEEVLKSFLEDEELREFVPDYELECMSVVEEYRTPFERCSKKHLNQMEEELSKMQGELERIENEQADVSRKYYELTQRFSIKREMEDEELSKIEQDVKNLKDRLAEINLELKEKEHLIFKTENYIDIDRQFAVYPDKEAVRSEITEEEISLVTRRIRSRIKDERQNY